MRFTFRIGFKKVLILSLFVISFWAVLFSFIDRNDSEVLHIFIQAEYANEDKIRNDLLQLLKDDGITAIEVTVLSEQNSHFTQTLLTSGLFESDILILKQSFVTSFDISTSFKGITVEEIHTIHPSLTVNDVFIQDEMMYGVALSDFTMSTYTISSDDTLYAFSSVYTSIHQSILNKVRIYLHKI